MIYLKWFLFTIVNLLLEIPNYLFAPIIVLFVNEDGYLPNWLYWFQTTDNSLDGDEGWIAGTRTIKNPTNKFHRWINRFRWIQRNSLYGFSEKVSGVRYDRTQDTLKVVGNPAIGNGPGGLSGTVTRYLYRQDKLIAFQWYYIHQWGSSPNCIRINIGWKLWNFDDLKWKTAIHVFSPSPYMHFIK
jgi:hypothetical protein